MQQHITEQSTLLSQASEPAGTLQQLEQRILDALHMEPRITIEYPADAFARAHETALLLHELGVTDEGMLVGYVQWLGEHGERKVLAERLGPAVHALSNGVSHLADLSLLSRHQQSSKQAHNHRELVRKMLITMVDDVRVVVIELAIQLVKLREAKTLPDEQRQQRAKLARDVYSALANRLGVWQIKWELEDLAFRYLQGEDYMGIARRLDEKRLQRETYIKQFIGDLEADLSAQGIQGEIYGRPKHIASIHKKMTSKGLSFDGLFDLRAVRVIVSNIAECYLTLGVIHTRWRHLPGEFDDYIATPKPNGYQSIHTVVIGPEEKTVEVQIRTTQMHIDNEFGVAAHWRYKEGAKSNESLDNKILWLRQLLDWQDELEEGDDPVMPLDATDSRVYAFTPMGRVIDLPEGSTAIDFAYAIHTDLGHSIRGAKINGKMLALNTPLRTGDNVEILRAKNASPSRDWLRPESKYVHTSKARNRIAHWFKQIDYDSHAAAGRSMLEKELERLDLGELSYEKIVAESNFKRVDDLLAAIGAGDFKLSKALYPFRRDVRQEDTLVVNEGELKPPKQVNPPTSMQIGGLGNLLHSMAKCCQPVPGDAIVGYLTSGRGVVVHRQSCTNVVDLDDERTLRLLDVTWGETADSGFSVDMAITAYNRNGMLQDISERLKSLDIDLHKVNMQETKDDLTQLHCRLGVQTSEQVEDALRSLGSIKNVVKVRRISHG